MGSVSIISTQKLVQKLGLNPTGDVQAFFTNSCYERMDKYVPKLDRNLREVVDINTNSITYESVYANYQYHGERWNGTHKVTKYTTPGTGAYWDRKMVSAEMKDLEEEIRNYMKIRG